MKKKRGGRITVNLRFKEFIDEIDTLIEFLTSDSWSFYGTPNPDPERIRSRYENQFYTGGNCRTFWILIDEETNAGIIRIYDLEDGDPLFDIMILKKFKGIGIGTAAVRWLSEFIFTEYPEKLRIEANTRQDNYAMRCVFHKCGYVKESHHRNAWVGLDGVPYDSVGYGMTSEDWQSGKSSPVNWNDFNC
ncbi:GNAT family N-acetyltransferase [Proteiniclasticum sp.]|uniref:GNAT family N-acetyltransferase n=1 Tax=Proteiniclasticum sp. TaxID=2053595 RepID=UPI0028993765|nr:GNAT family N-acetyltransferase [Proteiniclasticum sp.]